MLFGERSGVGMVGLRVVKLKENLSMYLTEDFFFRELDISVFTILHTALITKSSLDTELNTKVAYYNYSSHIQSYKC